MLWSTIKVFWVFLGSIFASSDIEKGIHKKILPNIPVCTGRISAWLKEAKKTYPSLTAWKLQKLSALIFMNLFAARKRFFNSIIRGKINRRKRWITVEWPITGWFFQVAGFEVNELWWLINRTLKGLFDDFLHSIECGYREAKALK